MSQTENTKLAAEINNYYQIVRNIPFSQYQNRWRDLVYKMQDGDSVLVRTFSESRSLITAFRRAGVKCKSRKMNKGFRIWRLG